jgi:integrase
LKGITIQAALDEYLASVENEIAPAVADQYRLVIGKLIEFCLRRSVPVHYMSQLTVDILDSFATKTYKNKASTTQAVGMAKVKALLNDAFRRGWIKEPLAKRIKKYSGQYQQAQPFTEEKVLLVLTGCNAMQRGNNGIGYGHKPETFRLLLELQLETGMRCGDATQYDPKYGFLFRAESGLWVYRFLPQKRLRKAKTAKLHDVYLTDRLKEAIDTCDWMSKERPFAWGSFKRSSYLANEVYYRMQAIGDRVGVEDCRPHRLRDTFAVRMLAKGLSLDDLKVLLGHSSVKITEQYYAAWTPARGTLLESKVTKALL